MIFVPISKSNNDFRHQKKHFSTSPLNRNIPLQDTMTSKEILNALKRCCRQAYSIQFRMDVIANLCDIVSNFCTDGYTQLANMVFKSLIFTMVEHDVPADKARDRNPNDANKFINEFIARNLTELVQNHQSLDVRDLCSFSRKFIYLKIMSTHQLLGALANHSSLSVQEISNLILLVCKICMNDAAIESIK